MMRFDAIRPVPKPIFGMLHLTGQTIAERLEIAESEARTLVENGVDGVVVENYFGDADDVRRVLERLSRKPPGALIGVNVLRNFRLAFDMAKSYPVDFIQIDSVAGHLPPSEDQDFAAELSEFRKRSRAVLLGGVRFKYQPVLSGRSEVEDLKLGADRSDAVVVTGHATGKPTDLDKVRRFRAALGNSVPLLIGAGLTAANAPDQLALADGAIVGSTFKDTRIDRGLVLGTHVSELMAVVRAARERAEPPRGTT
jgi:predicted TIM-barrel enzyme